MSNMAMPVWNLVVFVGHIAIPLAREVAFQLARHLAEVLDRKDEPVKGYRVPHGELAIDQCLPELGVVLPGVCQ